jgi:hypothetical protein
MRSAPSRAVPAARRGLPVFPLPARAHAQRPGFLGLRALVLCPELPVPLGALPARSGRAAPFVAPRPHPAPARRSPSHGRLPQAAVSSMAAAFLSAARPWSFFACALLCVELPAQRLPFPAATPASSLGRRIPCFSLVGSCTSQPWMPWACS